MPQHASNRLACLVLFSARSCSSSISPDRLYTAWLVSLVVFSCHMVSKWWHASSIGRSWGGWHALPVSRIEFTLKSSVYWPIIGLGTRTWSVAMRCRDPAGQSEFFVRVLHFKTFNWMYCYREFIVGIVTDIDICILRPICVHVNWWNIEPVVTVIVFEVLAGSHNWALGLISRWNVSRMWCNCWDGHYASRLRRWKGCRHAIRGELCVGPWKR